VACEKRAHTVMSGNPNSSPDYSILDAIQPIENPPRTSFLYQINLLLVAIAMVVLPLIYLGLVGLAGYGVYYHATHHASWFSSGVVRGRAVILVFFAYLIPLMVGCVIVFFMIKPIFAGRPKRAQPLALNPADNPLLYAFIERVCETVGAASPKRIDLNCDVNAAAGFRRGFFSLFGNDLVLTLGLPLVANLSTAELGGVIAHEFGHFTQSVGMRLSYIIRTINLWFIRVVYERDAWDEALEQWAVEVEDGRAAILIWTAQLGVFFARLILRILMFIGLLLGGFMLRQMEYDADAWEIKLAGSATFERTQRKLATLSAATEHMYKHIQARWQKTQELPDNLSELLRQAHESLPANILQKIEDAAGLEKTGWFDSHPSLADRIRQARRADEPGVFHDERPAATLFSSFEHPARFVTLLHYTDDLGIPVTEPMLRRVESKPGDGPGQPAVPRSVASTNHAALDRYLLGLAPAILPLEISLPEVPPSYETAMTELLQLTAGLNEVREQVQPIREQFLAATERLTQARSAAQLILARVKIDAAEFGLAEPTLAAAAASESEVGQTRAGLRHAAREIRAALQRRLNLGMALCSAGHGPDGTAAGELTKMMVALQHANQDYPTKVMLLEELEVFERIAALRPAGAPDAGIERALGAQAEKITRMKAPEAAAPAATAQPALQLKINRVKPVEVSTALATLRETREWLNNYHGLLSRMVENAESVEGIQG